MEEALVRVREFTLADAMPRLTQPLLIVHGENDKGFTVDDARRAFEAAGSADKTLRILPWRKAALSTATSMIPIPPGS